jgi:predicted ATP-dependent endonuclease of OLD family
MAAAYLFLCGHSLTKEYILLIDIYRSEIKPFAVTKLQWQGLAAI